MDRKITILIVGVSTLSLVFAGCNDANRTPIGGSHKTEGAVLGGGIGAGTGAIIGKQKGKAGQGALIGGLAGAGIGYVLGDAKDKNQARDARIAQLEEEAAHVVVNVRNSNNSVIQVRLRKSGVGYVGPRGEYYDHLPTEGELRPVYGF